MRAMVCALGNLGAFPGRRLCALWYALARSKIALEAFRDMRAMICARRINYAQLCEPEALPGRWITVVAGLFHFNVLESR
jgi:hypothetical protein